MRKGVLLIVVASLLFLGGGRIFGWGGGGEQPPADFVTGGGWIVGTPSGAKGNFGVQSGYQAMGDLGGPDPGGGNIQLHKGNASNTPPATGSFCPV